MIDDYGENTVGGMENSPLPEVTIPASMGWVQANPN